MLDELYETPVNDMGYSKLILADMSNIGLSTVMAAFKPDDLKVYEEALPLIRHLIISVTLAKVNKFRKNKETDDVVLCYDTKGTNGYWRRDVYPSYKANRGATRDKSAWNFDIIYRCLEVVQTEMSEIFPYKSVQIDRVEADDTIAVLSMEYGPTCEIIILSRDGDFLQLHQYGNIKQWDSYADKWAMPKYGTAGQDLLFKAIKGDKKDNISSIKCVEDHYTREDKVRAKPITSKELTEWMTDPDEIPEEYRDRFEQNLDALDFSRIPDHIRKEVLSIYRDKTPPSGKKMYNYMVKNGLVKLLETIQQF